MALKKLKKEHDRLVVMLEVLLSKSVNRITTSLAGKELLEDVFGLYLESKMDYQALQSWAIKWRDQKAYESMSAFELQEYLGFGDVQAALKSIQLEMAQEFSSLVSELKLKHGYEKKNGIKALQRTVEGLSNGVLPEVVEYARNRLKRIEFERYLLEHLAEGVKDGEYTEEQINQACAFWFEATKDCSLLDMMDSIFLRDLGLDPDLIITFAVSEPHNAKIDEEIGSIPGLYELLFPEQKRKSA